MIDWNALHFLRPAVLWALLALPVIAALWAWRRRRRIGPFALLRLRPARQQGRHRERNQAADHEKASPPLMSRQTPARKLAAGDAR
ncbi:MAG: BatA domain-containing protein [Stenotrophomonas sp.]|nr:BatA domain-containing protein [Stenotrophomonas sp.]